MPELAEVESNRREWDPGIGAKIEGVEIHGASRVARKLNPAKVTRALRGARLLGSEAVGKRMLFRFSEDGWLGIHLGMTGHLHVEPADFRAGRHDHLVLRQRARALVFTDSRQFGRLDFHSGKQAPDWWRDFPPAVTSSKFTRVYLGDFLRRHGRLPLKSALLLQTGFPGIGNWMADEILWQAGLSPAIKSGRLGPAQLSALWKVVRRVSRIALRTVGRDHSDPPAHWLFHQRWSRHGNCPRHHCPLRFSQHNGRTTAWCPRCQSPQGVWPSRPHRGRDTHAP